MADGLSAAVRTNLIALQRLAGDIDRVQNRLATGKRINGPLDGPAAYFTASALNARVAALNSVLDGIGNGKKLIEAANAGLEAIQSLVKNMRSLAYQALTSASTLAEVTGNLTVLSGATAIAVDNGDTITISDGADLNLESAMMLALKTRRDLALTSLSLAAAAEKAALRLSGST